MRLDPALVKAILATIEETEQPHTAFAELVQLGESREQVVYHVWQLEKGGFLGYLPSPGHYITPSEGYGEITSCFLLPRGHEFVAALEPTGTVERITKTVATKGVAISLDIMFAMATAWVKQKLELE